MESWLNFAGKINFVTRKAQKAQKWEPSQMANKGHTESTESTEMVAITDGGGMGSPEGEKLKENLIQNYTRQKQQKHFSMF